MNQNFDKIREEIKENLFKYIDEIIPKNEKKPSFNMNFIFQVNIFFSYFSINLK